MNFLQMVNRLRLEVGASGADLLSLGGTLSQENTRLKTWIAQAWQDIQSAHGQWKFMLNDVSFPTVIGQSVYASSVVGADFQSWKRDSFRAYLTATGFPDEQIIGFLDFPTYRNLYALGSSRTTTGRPVLFSVDQSKNFVIGPVPDAVYTVIGQAYGRAAGSVLSADTDTPRAAFDEAWHMAVVWKALESYAIYESAQEVLTRALRESTRLMSRLEHDQLPEMTYGAPLA